LARKINRRGAPQGSGGENNKKAYIEGSGLTQEQPIVDTLTENFMPYAMSVIISRALPEIDGFKPSHRKLLYTMYKMGLLNSSRTKSANIVGQTMKLNPHGDLTIYDTMVRLARGNESLLHPFVDSKGNFGKAYSRDMSYAASRYTEAKLEPICRELFEDIDRDTVDFVPNYDNETVEPTLLPVKFPSVLVNNNIGIAVSMASNICSFNLAEVCETTIALMKDPGHDIISTLKAPDFPGGGYILYDEKELRGIYDSGRGSVKVRAKYTYDRQANVIEVSEIPPTATVEAIIDKIVENVKSGKIREINDVRDETDLSGLKIAIDLKRGTDSEALMKKLYRLTPLQDTFSCNFNILIAGVPKVMGVKEILEEWTAFRMECVKRGVYFDLKKARAKLNLLLGLQKILLDIDEAIRIVRETTEESSVVPNLMIGFGIDEDQAEYVAEIKLRHLNREYILKRLEEIEDLRRRIADMEEILALPRRVKAIIVAELTAIAKKYGQPRKSRFVYAEPEEDEAEKQDDTPDYPVTLFFTKDGYFKKITAQSLRMAAEHKLKQSDRIVQTTEANNRSEILVFTDKQQCYKCRAADFDDCKAAALGDYLPGKLDFESDEKPVAYVVTEDYSGTLIICFENGKCAKIPLSSYETKTRRKKLQNAYSALSKAVSFNVINEDVLFLLRSSANKVLLFSTALILPKSTRDTQGVQVMKLTKAAVEEGMVYKEGALREPERFVVKAVPSSGTVCHVQLKL
jgi:DNA gyrase subunit A